MARLDDASERKRLLEAAIAEVVAAKDIGGFLLEGVAARAGVDAMAVRKYWANTPALFAAALQEWGATNIPIPDTGSFRGDLLEYARSYAAATNTPVGRKLLDAVVISPSDWDTYGSRETFRAIRPNRMAVMVRRAVERGEVAADLDQALAIEVLAAALSMPPLFYDQPITDQYCVAVVGMLLEGFLSR